jgi:hypothetical protein
MVQGEETELQEQMSHCCVWKVCVCVCVCVCVESGCPSSWVNWYSEISECVSQLSHYYNEMPEGVDFIKRKDLFSSQFWTLQSKLHHRGSVRVTLWLQITMVTVLAGASKWLHLKSGVQREKVSQANLQLFNTLFSRITLLGHVPSNLKNPSKPYLLRVLSPLLGCQETPKQLKHGYLQ